MVMDMIIKYIFIAVTASMLTCIVYFILKLTTKISISSFAHVVCSGLLVPGSSYMNPFDHGTQNNEISSLSHR
jgi:hypothetical protein